MKISVFGIGYVGCVSIGCLAHMGNEVIGVDTNKYKIELINRGVPTVYEKGIRELIESAYNQKQIYGTDNSIEAVLNSQISFICVGTPSDKNGHLNLNQLRKVAREIGKGLKIKKDFHTIVIRSTILPGTSAEILNILKYASNKTPDKDFCVLVNPEFLREGNAVEDFFNPSITIIGGRNEKGINILLEIYKNLPGIKKVVDIKVAETIKLLNNSFHALKVAFINEIGNISKILGINTQELIDIFLLDTKLNISTAYLLPGFAYGGSCLPKDLSALKLMAHDYYLKTPIINSIEISNQHQIERAINMIENFKCRHIGFWGITFKEGTDDLRNSPVVQVIERIIGRGYNVYLFDESVDESNLIGANKEYIEKVVPHFKNLILKNFHELLIKSEVIVINKKGSSENYKMILNKKDLYILDLKYIPELRTHNNYNGFNW
ncbi:MAG TPA: nucleotide sugar dehydrogenase [Bacteroidales bacterium]|nr:nucleotide sugar dehydrogenase [Bacteroidales bacterium]